MRAVGWTRALVVAALAACSPGEGPGVDAGGEPGADLGADAVAGDAGTDAVAGDAGTDPAGDAGRDLGPMPQGCCLADGDCLGTEGTPRCVASGWAAAGGVPWKTCEAALPEGWCWGNGDCSAGEVCWGVSVCPCNASCDFPYTGPGVCVVWTPDQACTAVDPTWVKETCDAASRVVWTGTACVETCPGCCDCGPFCDFVFESMDACAKACAARH